MRTPNNPASSRRICQRCGAGLDGEAVIRDMVHLQNVSLKLAQRITCDEEERQRLVIAS